MRAVGVGVRVGVGLGVGVGVRVEIPMVLMHPCSLSGTESLLIASRSLALC